MFVPTPVSSTFLFKWNKEKTNKPPMKADTERGVVKPRWKHGQIDAWTHVGSSSGAMRLRFTPSRCCPPWTRVLFENEFLKRLSLLWNHVFSVGQRAVQTGPLTDVIVVLCRSSLCWIMALEEFQSRNLWESNYVKKK